MYKFQGFSGEEEFIACQGPKEETTYDFWRMIDQYDVKLIVMLTQLVEKNKVRTILLNPGKSFELKFIPNQSDLFRNLFPRQSELIRDNPKKVFYLV